MAKKKVPQERCLVCLQKPCECKRVPASSWKSDEEYLPLDYFGPTASSVDAVLQILNAEEVSDAPEG